MNQPIWLRIDEEKEAVRALEIFSQHLSRAGEDPLSWKWALVALHNAVQNVVLASMKGPTLVGAVRPFIAEKWLQSGARASDTTMVPIPDYFLELYARMKNEIKYAPSVEVDIAVARLNEHRNAFIHYAPASWMVHVNELPGIARDCLQVVKALGWNPGTIQWQDESLRQKAQDVYDSCVLMLAELEAQYRL